MVFKGKLCHVSDSRQGQVMGADNLIGIDIVAEDDRFSSCHYSILLGSVMQPLRAEAATTAGLAR